MRIVATVQARMASSRLPNKSMALISDKPMASRVVTRLLWSKEIDAVVLSLPSGVKDEALTYMAQMEPIPFYAGEEQDVLGRLYQTAIRFNADAIVRITADCPLVDPRTVDQVVQKFKEGVWDYVSNVFPVRTHPAGLAVEVFSLALLKRLGREVPIDSGWREHPGGHIWNNPGGFRTANITHDPDLSDLRWTVDYIEDLEFVRRVYWELYKPGEIFHMEDVLRLLERAPAIAAINAHLGTMQYKSPTGDHWKCRKGGIDEPN